MRFLSAALWRNFTRLAPALVPLALVAGCKEAKQDAASTAPSGVVQQVEQNLRAGAPKATITFRGVQVYTQAVPKRIAVCGQANPFADDPKMFVPFVSIVTMPETDAPPARYSFEQYIGTSTSEAGRVYLAMVNYCYEKGGPAAGPNRGMMSMAPLPDTTPDPAVRAADPAPAVPAPSATAATGSVTMRRSANIHSDPKGPTVRVATQGTVLKVFAQAAGGWLQVGDAAPWGWVHESMVDRH